MQPTFFTNQDATNNFLEMLKIFFRGFWAKNTYLPYYILTPFGVVLVWKYPCHVDLTPCPASFAAFRHCDLRRGDFAASMDPKNHEKQSVFESGVYWCMSNPLCAENKTSEFRSRDQLKLKFTFGFIRLTRHSVVFVWKTGTSGNVRTSGQKSWPSTKYTPMHKTMPIPRWFCLIPVGDGRLQHVGTSGKCFMLKFIGSQTIFGHPFHWDKIHHLTDLNQKHRIASLSWLSTIIVDG